MKLSEHISGDLVYNFLYNDDIDIVRMAVDNGADINRTITGERSGNLITPLFHHIAHRNYDIVKYLVKKGADLNMRNGLGNTPLMQAKANGDSRMKKILSAKKLDESSGDVNARGNNGLEYATRNSSNGMILLREYGAKRVDESYMKDIKLQIDDMTYEEMLDRYKKSSPDDLMFKDPIGQYFAEQLEIKREMNERYGDELRKKLDQIKKSCWMCGMPMDKDGNPTDDIPEDYNPSDYEHDWCARCWHEQEERELERREEERFYRENPHEEG